LADDSDEAGGGDRDPPVRPAPVTAAHSHSRPRNRAERGAKLSSLAMRVRERYAALSPGERTVADLILAFPGRLATHSATELAQLAGASKATVTRCFRRLGYASYAEVRSEVRREQLWGSPYYLEQGSNQWSSPHMALEAHVAADSELLGATVDALTAVDLGAVIAALGGARRVVFIGYRNSHLLAAYASSQLALLRPGVELLPRVAETLAGGLAGLGPEDLVVGVGFRRRVQTFHAALEAVIVKGARVI
jgi:DNA-binding MurR/RpiR family transcriptional regulator